NRIDILNKSKNKKIVFWGSGEWVEKSIKLLNIKPEYIIDINKNIQGHKLRDIEIIPFEKISNIINDYYIVITTGSYHGLVENLVSKGLEIGKDFCYSPSLYNLSIRDEILGIEQNLLFSVPASGTENGGLYIYKTKDRSYTKIYDGKSRALCKTNSYIALADEEKGLVLFDKKLNLIKEIELLNNSVPHGITLSEKLNKIYVANSGRDSISIFDLSSYKHIEEIKLNDKYDRLKEEQHHINDLYVDEINETLFVSMFSFTGNWRKNIYDGGVLEYDLRSKKFTGPIISDMWMPHSIQMVDNKVMFVDSMRGDLYKTSNKIIGKFNGFIRGFDYDNKYLYIAQSSQRYFDRLQDISLNIPLDCGIYIFDEQTKASVFHSLPEFENIHSVIVLDK
ncbi:MAG: DUF4915 domain-containing protein, partial [Campylobacterota bacterium]|nr:DUF4915 domain-containing protein [Campylobacterota bacterium]